MLCHRWNFELGGTRLRQCLFITLGAVAAPAEPLAHELFWMVFAFCCSGLDDAGVAAVGVGAPPPIFTARMLRTAVPFGHRRDAMTSTSLGSGGTESVNVYCSLSHSRSRRGLVNVQWTWLGPPCQAERPSESRWRWRFTAAVTITGRLRSALALLLAACRSPWLRQTHPHRVGQHALATPRLRPQIWSSHRESWTGSFPPRALTESSQCRDQPQCVLYRLGGRCGWGWLPCCPWHLCEFSFGGRGVSATHRRSAGNRTTGQRRRNGQRLHVPGRASVFRVTASRTGTRYCRGDSGSCRETGEAYSETGQGLAADSDRARTEWYIRKNDVLRAEESARVASSRLAQLLRLDPTVPLIPQEPALVPIHLFPPDEPVQSLVTQGLTSRPEVRESRALVCEAVHRLERERLAPLMPSVALGISQGGFGAGRGGDISRFDGRFDADAMACWELRNLGHGEVAARNEMRSRLEQARWREVAMLDQIAREVVEAHAQVEARAKQLEIGKSAVLAARSSYERNLDGSNARRCACSADLWGDPPCSSCPRPSDVRSMFRDRATVGRMRL